MTQMPESREQTTNKMLVTKTEVMPPPGAFIKVPSREKYHHLTSFDFFSMAATNYFEYSPKGPSHLPIS